VIEKDGPGRGMPGGWPGPMSDTTPGRAGRTVGGKAGRCYRRKVGRTYDGSEGNRKHEQGSQRGKRPFRHDLLSDEALSIVTIPHKAPQTRL